MAKLVGEVLREARARLHEPTPARWENDDLRAWLNEAQREIATRFKWYRKNGTVSAVAGTQTYSLPSDCLFPYQITYAQTGTGQAIPLEFTDRRNVAAEAYTQLTSARGVPTNYWTEGYPGTTTFKLSVFPTPTTSADFRVDYYGVPADWSVTGSDDDDNILVPNGYESLVVDFIAFHAKLSDGDADWQQYKALYEQNLAGFEETMTNMVANVGQISPVGVGFDEMW
jgi:hypothetical protein